MFVLTIIVTIKFPVLRTELYKKFRIIFLIIKAVYISSPWRSIGIKSIWYFFLLAENKQMCSISPLNSVLMFILVSRKDPYVQR